MSDPIGAVPAPDLETWWADVAIEAGIAQQKTGLEARDAVFAVLLSKVGDALYWLASLSMAEEPAGGEEERPRDDWGPGAG